MKAVVYTRYGGPDVLRLTDADTPVPGDGQELVKVPWQTPPASSGRCRLRHPVAVTPPESGRASRGTGRAGRGTGRRVGVPLGAYTWHLVHHSPHLTLALLKASSCPA